MLLNGHAKSTFFYLSKIIVQLLSELFQSPIWQIFPVFLLSVIHSITTTTTTISTTITTTTSSSSILSNAGYDLDHRTHAGVEQVGGENFPTWARENLLPHIVPQPVEWDYLDLHHLSFMQLTYVINVTINHKLVQEKLTSKSSWITELLVVARSLKNITKG